MQKTLILAGNDYKCCTDFIVKISKILRLQNVIVLSTFECVIYNSISFILLKPIFDFIVKEK